MNKKKMKEILTGCMDDFCPPDKAGSLVTRAVVRAFINSKANTIIGKVFAWRDIENDPPPNGVDIACICDLAFHKYRRCRVNSLGYISDEEANFIDRGKWRFLEPLPGLERMGKRMAE